MLIECDRCVMRDIAGPDPTTPPMACSDCVVTVLLATPDRDAELGEAERRALRVLADARMIPPLRLRADLPRAS